jgi:EAL domain-containing protein (putative c-di-GMP-specific phosphodiesterase class I)
LQSSLIYERSTIDVETDLSLITDTLKNAKSDASRTFNYLKQLPAQHVKIDGSFVRDMINDPIDLALVKAINDISRSLDKRSVAEYVESEEIFFALKEIGVDYGQGYFIARPVPVEKVQSTLKIIYQKKPFIQQHTSAS